MDRISYLEEKIDGVQQPVSRSKPDDFSLKALKSELMKDVDGKTRDIVTIHEEFGETKAGLEKRIKLLERKLQTLQEAQDEVNSDLRMEIENITGSPDPLKNTQELEKKMKLLDQKRRKDNQDIQDELMDLIDQKLIVIQKEKANKLDRLIREMNDLAKRVDIHDDDLLETTRVIQELDRDRIQDGKTTEILKQKYELLDERVENLSEAISEMNNIVNRVSKIQVDHNDLNVIKEACLQDFNTLNERINDVSETVEVLSHHVEQTEKEIEAIKVVKQPRVSMIKKDIASPLRSSMSQHLGSNLNKRRSDSQNDLHRMENIQRLTDQDTFSKYEPRHIQERESVLSGSKINRYLGDSFDDSQDYHYKTNPDKVVVFKDSSRGRSQEKDGVKFQGIKKRMMRASPGEDVIVEDIDSGHETDRKKDGKEPSKAIDSNQKPMSSRQSECTFKADEIFNNKSEQDSHRQPKKPNQIDLTDQSKNIWGAPSSGDKRKSDMLVKENASRGLSDQKSAKLPAEGEKQPERFQLGPIGGDTLDEESSEEDFESELSMEDNQYFQGHIVQKHKDLKQMDKKQAPIANADDDDDWDYEEEEEKPKSN